jgi:FkbM family methyltransferase
LLPLDHVEAPLIRDILTELTAGDDVVVIGAYKGSTCSFIRHYNPYVRLVAFEPQDWAFEELLKVAHASRIVPWKLALSTEDKTSVPLYEYGTDAASLLAIPGSRTKGTCRTVDAAKFLPEHYLNKIAFVIMNIEGYEYALVPYLLVSNIEMARILVQCHHKDMYRTAHSKMQASLNAYGYTMLDVGAGWELWRK